MYQSQNIYNVSKFLQNQLLFGLLYFAQRNETKRNETKRGI